MVAPGGESAKTPSIYFLVDPTDVTLAEAVELRQYSFSFVLPTGTNLPTLTTSTTSARPALARSGSSCTNTAE